MKTCTMIKNEKELNKNIGSKSLHHFIHRLLKPSARQQVTIRSQQNCSKQERQYWTECTEYVWRSGKLVSGQRNGRSPRSSHFPRKVILNRCKLQINCSCLTCKQDPSSGHTGKDPSEDSNGNCRRTGGIATKKGDKRPNHKSQNTDARGTRAPTTTLYVLCGLQEAIRLSPMISCG